MDIINQEKKYPTLVELVNDPQNPNKVEITNLPFAASNALNVQVATGSINVYQIRPNSGRFNVTLDNVLLLQSDGTFVPIPLATILTNVTQANIDSTLASYKTAYAILTAGVASATLHYSKLQSNGTTTSEVYSLKD